MTDYRNIGNPEFPANLQENSPSQKSHVEYHSVKRRKPLQLRYEDKVEHILEGYYFDSGPDQSER